MRISFVLKRSKAARGSSGFNREGRHQTKKASINFAEWRKANKPMKFKVFFPE